MQVSARLIYTVYRIHEIQDRDRYELEMAAPPPGLNKKADIKKPHVEKLVVYTRFMYVFI